MIHIGCIQLITKQKLVYGQIILRSFVWSVNLGQLDRFVLLVSFSHFYKFRSFFILLVQTLESQPKPEHWRGLFFMKTPIFALLIERILLLTRLH